MPYITQSERDYYDDTINELCKKIDSVIDPSPGHLNYIITRVCLDIFKKNTSYTTLALITGVLENVKQELYRRQFADYEDAAIKKNGDL